jgi:hypothetical protein
MIVWVPGALKTAAMLKARLEGIGNPDGNVFWELPGHGEQPQTKELSIPSWADSLAKFAKQWALQVYLRTVAQDNPHHRVFHAMIEAFFCVLPDGGQAERNYYPLLEGLASGSRPCVYAICSDLPLWPSGNRPVDLMPSTNDEIDRYMLSRAGVEVCVLSGPHNLLDVSTAACNTTIERWLTVGSR